MSCVSSLSREEYLKRYLSGDNADKKTKKKKLKPKISSKFTNQIRIIDVDIGMKDIRTESEANIEEVDEAPQVADIIDDRPEHIQIKEYYNAEDWKTFGDSESAQNEGDQESISAEQKVNRVRHDSDSDTSPTRIGTNSPQSSMKSPNFSPSRKNSLTSSKEQDSDGDFPVERTGRSSRSPKPSTSTGSGKICEVLVSTGKRTRFDSDSDLSPERVHDTSDVGAWKDSDVDFSPVRVNDSKDSPRRHSKSLQKSRNKSSIDGSREGSSKAAREDARDKRSHVSSEDEDHKVTKIQLRGERKKEEELKKKAEDERKAKYAEWGKGLDQQEERLKRFEADSYEITKPLARYKDDEDLDSLLKQRCHVEDPMYAYMQKKNKALPLYNGPPAPQNRFNIQPGYRWDGVDRSNGFEQKLISKTTNAKSNEAEAYLWSVQDM